MPTILETKTLAYETKRGELTKYFADRKTAEGFTGWTDEDGLEVKRRNDELLVLNTDMQRSRDMEEIERKHLADIASENRTERPIPFPIGTKGRIGHDGASLMDRPPKSFGQRFIESKSFIERGGAKNFAIDIPDFEVKTLFSTTAGFDPFVTRLPRIQLTAQQEPKLVDSFPIGETTEHVIKYMLETLYTSGAGAVLEGGTYGESAFTYAEQLSPIQKIAAFLPITDEQVDDVGHISALLNNRMDLQIRQAFDQEVALGSGTNPHIRGLMNTVGINARAQIGGEPAMDTILRAMNDVATVGFATPSCIWMNPTDWMNIRLLRTADGIYIWGHPAATGPNTIWGLPVITCTTVTLGSFVVGDFAGQSMVWMRKGLSFEVANQHSDWFQKGQRAIRAELRAGLTIYRPSAFTLGTGI